MWEEGVTYLDGFHWKLDVVALFCDIHWFTINLGETKAKIFKASKKFLFYNHLFFKGEEIEITTTYTYLGVLFTDSCFSFWNSL